MRKFALLLSASALTLGWCTTAQAQTAASNNTVYNSETIETVVVTAERRSENLMTTPISADVLSGEDLQARGVLSVDALEFIAPSVAVDDFGQGIDFDIRGIGKGEHNTQTPTGVITYRDGVPTFPGYMTEEPYYDIANIQVLRGPQGTLAGENATGGAVFVNTNDPVIGGGYDGYAMASLGNYFDTSVQGAVNIPVSDDFAARIALFTERRDSFYTVTDNGKPYKPGMPDLDWAAARLGLMWKPSDPLTITFKLDTDYLDNGGYDADPYTDRFKVFPKGSPLTPAGTVNPYYTDLFHITGNYPQTGLDRFIRANLKIEYDFPDGMKFRSMSAYNIGNTNYGTDLDGTDYGSLAYMPLSYVGYGLGGYYNSWIFWDRVSETQWTEELNLISPDNQRVTWVIGAFADANRYDWIKPYQFDVGIFGNAYFPGQNYPNGVPPFGSAQYNAQSLTQLQGSTPNMSWATFGQADVKVTDAVSLTLGARWSSARSKNDVDILSYGTYIPAYQATKSYSFDYKAALNWIVNENNFLYGLVATSFKPSGLNTPPEATGPYSSIPPFGPERVLNYEIGWKATMLDGHVRTQIDGYYNDLKHFQVSIGFPQDPFFSAGYNDPNTTKLYGLEFETQAVFGNLAFDAGLGWEHSELGQFYVVDPRVGATAACDPSVGPGSATCIDLKGHPQTYAPSLTGNFSVQYTFDLSNGDKLTPRVNYSYASQQWATLIDNPALGDRLGLRQLLGAQLDWTHGTWIATLYGSNLMNLHYVAAMNSDLDWAGAPRQFGIRLMKVF